VAGSSSVARGDEDREREEAEETESEALGSTMPIWTFTSGPHKGKKYEGSAMAVDDRGKKPHHASSVRGQGVTDLQSVKRLMKNEGLLWGRVDRLTCRRDVTVVATDSKAFLASFDLAKLHSSSRCNQNRDTKAEEEEEGGDESFSFRFTDVPVISPEVKECGQAISMHSNIQDGDAIEIKLLSEFTCVLRKLSPSALSFHMKERRKEEVRSKLLANKTKVHLLRGNQDFKLGQYARAHECYEAAIRQSKSSRDEEEDHSAVVDLVKCYANNGLTLLHLQRIEAAEEMCNTALRLTENQLKLKPADQMDRECVAEIEVWKIRILLRRAKVTLMMGVKRLEDSLCDLDKVLSLQPMNKDAASMKDQIQQEITTENTVVVE
jgi:tetratricopeptide (TPR) repeat protein